MTGKKKIKITPKLKAELEAMAIAVKVLSTGWVKGAGDGEYRKTGVPDAVGESWKVLSEDVRALLCIDILGAFSDAAIRTQYGRKALELLREIQGMYKTGEVSTRGVETEKLTDFYHEIEAAESRKQGFEETMDLGLEVEEPPKQAAPIELLPRVVTESIAKITREAEYIPTNGEAREFSVDPARKICITAALTVTEGNDLPDGITLKKGRTPWKLTDRGLMVQDAVGTMFYHGKLDFTLNDLSVMMGGGRDMTKKRRAELKAELETQRNVDGYIDWTNQLNDMKKKAKGNPKRLSELNKCKAIYLDDKIMPVAKGVFKLTNGEEVEVYHIHAAPMIHAYSRQTGQIMDVPIAALNVPGVNSTAENDVIIRHLHFMVSIANRFHAPQNVLLDTILERTHKKGCSNKERGRIAERITRCLEHFAGIKFIRKFEPIQGTRGKLEGWTIYPANKNVHALPTGKK